MTNKLLQLEKEIMDCQSEMLKLLEDEETDKLKELSTRVDAAISEYIKVIKGG